MKSNHFGRNIASHDLTVMPSSSEVISYLGDAIKIAKISSEYKKRQKSKIIQEPAEVK